MLMRIALVLSFAFSLPGLGCRSDFAAQGLYYTSPVSGRSIPMAEYLSFTALSVEEMVTRLRAEGILVIFVGRTYSDSMNFKLADLSKLSTITYIEMYRQIWRDRKHNKETTTRGAELSPYSYFVDPTSGMFPRPEPQSALVFLFSDQLSEEDRFVLAHEYLHVLFDRHDPGALTQAGYLTRDTWDLKIEATLGRTSKRLWPIIDELVSDRLSGISFGEDEIATVEGYLAFQFEHHTRRIMHEGEVLGLQHEHPGEIPIDVMHRLQIVEYLERILTDAHVWLERYSDSSPDARTDELTGGYLRLIEHFNRVVVLRQKMETVLLQQTLDDVVPPDAGGHPVDFPGPEGSYFPEVAP